MHIGLGRDKYPTELNIPRRFGRINDATLFEIPPPVAKAAGVRTTGFVIMSRTNKADYLDFLVSLLPGRPFGLQVGVLSPMLYQTSLAAFQSVGSLGSAECRLPRRLDLERCGRRLVLQFAATTL